MGANIPWGLFLISLVNFLLVKLNRLEAALILTGHSPLAQLSSLGLPLQNFSLLRMTALKHCSRKCQKKSCDLDPVPTPFLHDCLAEITPIVADIVNKSLSCGVVPQCFKHALVKPPLKKANLDPNCLSNSHPVSSPPFLSKVLERIVLKHFLQIFLESRSLLEPFQSAYRKCHSTETTLLRVVNDLLQASDNGHVSIYAA